MRKLLNTLYVLSENVFLSLDGKNIVLKPTKEVDDGMKAETKRFPLQLFQDVVSFSYVGASPALMGYCVSNGIGLAFCRPNGRLLARVAGPTSGNVLLRRTQYRVADDPALYVPVCRNMIAAKLYNQRQVLERTKRNHGVRLDVDKFSVASGSLSVYSKEAMAIVDPDTLRGVEGLGAKAYFDLFDAMIFGKKPEFSFQGRTRRPPLDRVNAMLSFGYSILSNDCASALEAFGLDAYVGFLHRDRPGRKSLALDLMEELRAPVVERMVISMINNRQVSDGDFTEMDDGAVLLSDFGRRTFFTEWQSRKKELITHPYLGEKIHWGLLPYIQAQLLSRYLRGDIDGYPPFLWR